MLPSVNKYFVVEVNQFIIGCIALDIYSKRIAEIRSLAVRSNYQDKGIGQQLVQACIDKAKKEGIHELFAVTGQERFFNKLGFNRFQEEKVCVFKTLGQ